MNAVQKPKRNTWQREAVRSALSGTEGFVSAQALHQHLLANGAQGNEKHKHHGGKRNTRAPVLCVSSLHATPPKVTTSNVCLDPEKTIDNGYIRSV